MEKIIINYFKTDFGELLLGSYEDKLCICDWKYRKMRTTIDNRIQNGLNSEYLIGNTEIIETTKIQLDEYFSGKRTAFDIKLQFIGTEFQKKVWNLLMEVPYGKTETYLGLALKLNNRNAIRAVATANGANAISILVPCHRIIGSNRELIGYAGGLNAKKKLLELEGVYFKTQQKLF